MGSISCRLKWLDLSAKRVLLILGAVCVAFLILSWCSFLDNAQVGSELFSRLGTLSISPSPVGFYAFLVFILVLAVLAVVGLALVLRKHLKKIVGVALLIVAVIAGVYVAWSVEPSINYWLVSVDTTSTRDNSLTMYSENIGGLAGTFDLVVQLTNAHVSLKTSLPYQLIDSQTAKFTFTLQSGEQQNRQLWYIINGNVTDFYITLSFQQNGGNFFVKSSQGGVDSVSYQKDASGNFTIRTFAPPP
jgi:hypothetical protein